MLIPQSQLLEYIHPLLLIKVQGILYRGSFEPMHLNSLPQWVWWVHHTSVVYKHVQQQTIFSSSIFYGSPIFDTDKWSSSQVELRMDESESDSTDMARTQLMLLLSHSLTPVMDSGLCQILFSLLLLVE